MIAYRFSTKQSLVAMLGMAQWSVESDSHEQLPKKSGANSGIDPKQTDKPMRTLGFEVYGGNYAARVG